MKTIFHITHFIDWEFAKAAGEYTADSLETQGFIHCSEEKQLVKVANAFFKDEQDLILLMIDVDRLKSPIMYEDLQKEGEEFPHIYGPLNLDAVVKIVPFPSENDGTFKLPGDLMDDNRFARTPKPPYFAVVFSSQRTEGDQGYADMADKMNQLAKTQPGFLGMECARDPDGFGITVSYWDSLENIQAWRKNTDHGVAKMKGRKEWYKEYRVRITKVDFEISS